MQLLLGDCLEVMKTLPDKSVDLFICDLPYGCLTNKRGPERGKGTNDLKIVINMPCPWDIPIDLAQFWVQVKRLAKDDHTPVLMFCTTKFGNDLINSNPDWFRYDLVWNKMRGVGFLNANKMPLRSHEMIYVFSKKCANYYRKDEEGDFKSWHRPREEAINGIYGATKHQRRNEDGGDGVRCVKSIVDAKSKALKGKHPTQKPDDLYAWLIERYSKPGDTVLDPTAGSFASVFTAEKMGRRAIGIEMDEEFFQKAIAASRA